MSQKISIRFYNDREVRAVWDDAASKWGASVYYEEASCLW